MQMPTILSACTAEEASRSRDYEFEASLCLDCGLGYNSRPLPTEVLEDIYRNYHYIRPQKGIGVSKYEEMLKCLGKHTRKDQHLVEIGSSDGYLVDSLATAGYANLEGIEPSKESSLADNQHLIRNEFFDENTRFDKPVDAFFLMHVLEHFQSPRQIVSLMKRHLSENGKIIFEVPNFGGFHHQHLLFFSRPFVYQMAAKTGFSVIEIDDTQAVLRAVLKKSEASPDSSQEFSPEIVENLLVMAKKAGRNQIMIRQEVEDFLKKMVNKRVYWWGTGSTSILTLANIDRNLLTNLDLIVIDGDIERKGLCIPIFDLENTRIYHPTEITSEFKKDDALVIASSFSKEIIAGLQDGVIPEQIHSITL